MTTPDFITLRNLAIILIFTVLFGTAAVDKFKTLQTPDWFVKQFEGTLIAKLPGGAKLGYWKIAIFELLLTVAFLMSIFIDGVLPWALLGSAYLFAGLCLGLRLTRDYQGSANMFVYFTATLVSLYMVQ